LKPGEEIDERKVERRSGLTVFVVVFGFMIVAAKAAPKVATQGPHTQAPSVARPKKAEEQFITASLGVEV
jgi:hypothetical protein